MIEALHTGMMANVSVGGEVSEFFSVTNGIKQGCVLAPTLFSIFLSAVLDKAFRDMGDGVYIQSRQSADLFNVAQFRAKTKTTRILLFADDSALVGHSAEEMQKIMDAVCVFHTQKSVSPFNPVTETSPGSFDQMP